MARIENLLAPEDAEAYRAARGIKKSSLDMLREDIPDWKDDLEVMQHQRYTTKPPAMADLLATNIFNKKSLGATARRFSTDLDLHYLNSDGTFNHEQWKADNFVINVEKAYYENRGQVPMQFFIENSEDLGLLGGEFSEAAKNLHRLSLIESARLTAKTAEQEAFQRDIDFIADWQRVGKQSALMAWTNFENIYNSFGKDDARGQEALDEISPGLSYAELRQMYEPIGAVDTPIKAGYVYEQDEKIVIYAPDGAVGSITRKKGDVAGEGEFRPGQERRRSYSELSTKVADMKFGQDHMQLIGDAMGWAVSGVAGAIDRWGSGSGGALDMGQNLQNIGRWLDDGDYERGKLEAISAMEDQIGLSRDEFVLQAGLPGALEAWSALPEVDPNRYAGYVAMAGGDLDLAQDLYTDEILFQSDNRAMAEKQQEIYNQQLEYQIHELENENFTTSQAVLSIIASWGEAMEFAATAVVTGIGELYSDDPQRFWEDSFWQEVADNKTPAGALGLDGTLMGLGVDLAATAAVDPTTYLFGPKLARAGRWGARSADDVVRISNSPASGVIRRQSVELARSTSRNGVGYSALLDNMAATGMDEMYVAGLRGHNSPLTTARPYTKNKKVAAATNDVTYNVIQELYDMDLMDRDMVQKAADNIKKNGVEAPVEITVNPNTGKAAITKNGETGLAIQMLGHDAIPTMIKIDPDFGVNTYVRIKGMSDDAARHVHDIADGTIAKNIEDAGRVVKEDRKAVDKMLTRNKEFVDYVPDPELEGIFGERMVDDAVEIVNKKNDTALKIIREEQAGVVNYHVFNKADEGLGGVAIVDEQITMGLKGEALGAMDQIWDVALQKGDDLMAIHGYSPSTSRAAIKFAQRRAKRLIDEADPKNTFAEAADDIVTHDVEWGRGLKVPDENLIKMDGDIYVNPRRSIGDEIYGDVDWDHLKYLEQEHMLRGGDPIAGQKTAMSASLGKYFGDRMRNSKGKVGQWVNGFITPINSNIKFEWTGAWSRNAVNQVGVRLWSAVDDMTTWSLYQDRFMNIYRNRGFKQLEANRLSAEAGRLQTIIDSMNDFVGGGLDDWVERLGVEGDEAAALAARHRTVTDEVAKVQKELDSIYDAQKTVQAELTSYKPMNDLMQEMFEDYNRRHIATHESWKPFVDKETGLVPWEEISGRAPGTSMDRMQRVLEKAKAEGITVKEAAQGELGIIPEDVAAVIDAVEESGIKMNVFLDDALQALQNPSSYVAPASPLEMMTAGSGGRNASIRIRANRASDTVMEFARKGQMYWSLDKVMTPRTAIVVSADEVIRIGHQGGVKSYLKYFEDKAIHMAERVDKAITREGSHLPQRWKDRLVKLQEYPTFYRQLERSFLETNGIGFDTIAYKKVGDNTPYYSAAQRFTGSLLNDEGFRKSLSGFDNFKRWFDTDTKAARLRNMEFVDADGTTRTGLTAEQAFGYYDRMLNDYALSNIAKGKKGEARALWKDAAERQAAAGSTAGGPVTLPDWVLEGYGQVTGNAMISERGMGLVNKATDALFQRPVDYRRGFLAEWVRESEKARLGKLYASQGRKVISDNDVHLMLKRQHPDWTDAAIEAQAPILKQQLVERHGMLTEQFVNELIEQKVISEMENVLYSFQMNSRAGRSSRILAPFGKPWADMWAHWGREMISRPQLRGVINDTNFLNLGQIANKVVDHLPFNPKGAAFVSRIAATDFNLDRIQEDPIVGAGFRAAGIEGLDVGPGLFLPHEGENPFGVLFPGLGIVPVGGLQAAFNHLAPDPIDDPVGYQQWVDEWSQFIPGIGYNQSESLGQGLMNLIMGGGVVSKVNDQYQNLATILGEGGPAGQPHQR